MSEERDKPLPILSAPPLQLPAHAIPEPTIKLRVGIDAKDPEHCRWRIRADGLLAKSMTTYLVVPPVRLTLVSGVSAFITGSGTHIALKLRHAIYMVLQGMSRHCKPFGRTKQSSPPSVCRSSSSPHIWGFLHRAP